MRLFYCEKFNYPIISSLQRRYNRALLKYLVYNSTYESKYPLFEPSLKERLKFRLSTIELYRNLLIIKNSILQKLKPIIK